MTMPDPTAGLRARILEALVTAPAGFVRDDSESAGAHASRPWRRHDQHHYYGGCALCRGEADTLVGAVMAVLDEAFPPQLAIAADFEITHEQAAAWQAAWTEAFGADEAGPRRFIVAPPNAVMIYRRTPEQRRAYLTGHRDEALANGIPADLIDMMIADAEAGGSDG